MNISAKIDGLEQNINYKNYAKLWLKFKLLQFTDRFMAQLKKPDPQAPVLPQTDPAYNPNLTKIQRRQYRTLNTFIRAMIIQSHKME